jgi:NADH-quinone oxidoreductase subunit M
MDGLLLTLILAPLTAALVGAFLPNHVARYWALGASLFVAGIALILAFAFPWTAPLAEKGAFGVQWANTFGEVEAVGFGLRVGVDSIALSLVCLTAWLTPLAIASSFYSVRLKESQYYAWLLLLLGAMLGVFVSRDALLFYIFFELTLVPMFFLIGIWGGANRHKAAVRFFIFTFTGSVFTLAALLYLATLAGSFDLSAMTIAAQSLDGSSAVFLGFSAKALVLLGLLAGFAVKVPLFPVHTWLPLAHTEAPTAGSVILAGVLLKLGTFGLLRLAVPMGLVSDTGFAPYATTAVQILAVLCIIGIIYGALVAWVQQDIKKLVAYSSVSHLGFCVLGLVALNDIGVQGSVFYMINHGISTGAMFLVIGMIYDRFHTRDIDALGGLAKRMPVMAFFFILFVMSSIGLPGTNGFISEFLTVQGAFVSTALDSPLFGVFAALGVILGAVYMLHLAAKILFGPLRHPEVHDEKPLPADLNGRELALLTPLAIAVIVLGLVPQPLMQSIQAESQLALEPVGAMVLPVADAQPAGLRLVEPQLPGVSAVVGQ